MGQTNFLFKLSKPRKGLSPLAQATVHLAEIAERIANEDRTVIDHVSGRAENVAEHSNMLGIVAAAIAEEFFTNLDANLVARYATIHDLVEAYVGDTATHKISEQEMVEKEALEKQGLEKLKADYKHLPKFVSLVVSYEDQKVPEARFVRVMDKCMPALVHFSTNGTALRRYFTKAEVLENSAQRAGSLRAKYPEFERIIALREELSKRMAEEYL
jgi:5'-deoxynucleotidase YfbR-like HD superfamily hydrolase